MKTLRWVRAAGLSAVLLSVPAAQAAPCAGFTDVDSTSPFCANVEWIKNRGVTLGCTSATTYCPGTAVTRLQMAAFLNRLGNALTPEYLFATASSTAASLAPPGVQTCQTNDLPAQNYQRRAVLDGIVIVNASATSQGVTAATRHSTDAGATWDASVVLSYGVVSNTPAYDGVTLPVIGEVDLGPFLSYRFDVRVSSVNGTAGTANVYCRLRVRIENHSPPPPA